jgi:dihydrofolate synthase/folylpolyglutamate synthase
VQDPLSYLFGLEHFGIKFGLQNIRSICDRLGHPERAFRTVHVAGTNGKGSVTAMVDAGLRAAGHRTARYTSPHRVRLNERFVIDGRAVGDADLLDAISTVRHVVDELVVQHVLEAHPTFFEVTTAVAFELFRRAAVDIAVVEVGLGGRLDATNVITPEVTAITSIAYDHQLYLGSSLESIAGEKAGIIKAGAPVVVGAQPGEVFAVIAEAAHAAGAPIVRAHRDDIASFDVALAGDHQRDNAAIALKVLEALNERGVPVPRNAIAAALRDTVWPGRLDLRRLDDGRELILDAAHNTAGAGALAAYLRTQPEKLPLVFAAMRDKAAADMFAALLPEVRAIVCTRAENPRSADPVELAEIARTISPAMTIRVATDIGEALDVAWQSAPAQRIVVAGSIFLLGDVMRRLGLHC